MTRSTAAALTLTLLFALAPAASAQETADYMISSDLKTNFFTDRFSGHGLSIANKHLREMSAARAKKVKEAIWDMKGTVLAEHLTEWGIGEFDKVEAKLSGWAIRDGKHTLIRRKGRLDILFRGPAELPKVGLLADAVKVDSNDLVEVRLSARDRERDVRIGSRPVVKLTVTELWTIRTQPAGVKRTAFGALLRHAWAKTLGDIEDDVEVVEARMEVAFGGLTRADGKHIGWVDQRIPSDKVDLVLGRKITNLEWMGNLLGRSEPLLELDDAHANALVNSLRRADPGARAQIERLRLREVRTQLEIDQTFSPEFLNRLDGSRSGASSRLPQ